MGCCKSKSEFSENEVYKPPALQNEADPLIPQSQKQSYSVTSPSAVVPSINTGVSHNTEENRNTNGYKFMKKVRMKLVKKLKGREEDLVRVLYFLASEDSSCSRTRPYTSHWDNLNKLMKESDTAFNGYVESIIREAKMPAAAQEFNIAIEADSKALLEYSGNAFPTSNSQKYDLSLLTKPDLAKTSSLMGLVNAWPVIPNHSKTLIMNFIRSYLPKNAVVAVQLCVDNVETFGTGLVSAALASVHLSAKVCEEIRRWWRGEVSGLRCSQNIVNDTFAVAAGGVGAVAGGFYGSVAGPVGAFAGAVIGGVISAYCAQLIVDRLTQTLFGLPKSEALENAYNYLGVNMKASNNEINNAFRRLCKQHHPDKGGDKDEFLVLQCHMAVIREARAT